MKIPKNYLFNNNNKTKNTKIMELNLFKHYYFVIISYKHWAIGEKKGYMFIQCRAKDISKTILSKIPDEAELTGIESVTKLD